MQSRRPESFRSVAMKRVCRTNMQEKRVPLTLVREKLCHLTAQFGSRRAGTRTKSIRWQRQFRATVGSTRVYNLSVVPTLAFVGKEFVLDPTKFLVLQSFFCLWRALAYYSLCL